jgi:serine/threonine protein kinase
MNCPICRREIADNAAFCGSCGVPTVRVDAAETIVNSPDTNPPAHPGNDPHDDRDPRIGLILDSKYELLERLGQGGMGTVYRARRLHIGDEVAVKLLSHELVREEQALARFRREARSAAMIRHQNVVSIHDFNDASGVNGESYIVMELVKGESLRSLLERDGRLPAERAVALMRDICAGVGVAHRLGLLHRDLKPDNVIVTPPSHEREKETAKVVDFGLAKVRDAADVSALTRAGVLLGTLYYMSPEQCRGEDLDARSDVYSLGAMFYEMLAGVPPFKSSNLTGLISKHLNDPPPPFDPSIRVPPTLAHACFVALAKNRDERQADAIAFGHELAKALVTSVDQQVESVSENSRMASPSSPSIQAKQKSPLLNWVIGIGAVAVLAIGLVGVGIAIKFGADMIFTPNSTPPNGQAQTATPAPTEAANTPATGTDSDVKTVSATLNDLRGRWTGTYGSMGQPATLIIKTHDGKALEGVLEQGAVRVAFMGTIKSGSIRMKQSAVLSGDGWSLGEDTGTVSNDGQSMSGTGKDIFGGSMGMTYQWSFKR